MPSEKPTFLRIPKRAGVQTDHGGDQDGPPTPTTQRPTDEEPVGSGSDTIAGGGKDTTTGGGGENPSTGGDGKDTTTGGGSDASGGGSGDDTTNGGGSGPAKTITRTWQSGDFQETPRDNPPYNGITITASYQPNSDGGFDGAKIVFTDYTLVKKGASTTIPDLRVSKDWTPVPQPKAPSKTANDSTSPAKQVETGEQGKAADAPSDDETFTIKGDVRIQSETNGSFLRVRLQYGAARVREEIGFVFRLDASEQTPKKAG